MKKKIEAQFVANKMLNDEIEKKIKKGWKIQPEPTRVSM
jgi:hypothetical protein